MNEIRTEKVAESQVAALLTLAVAMRIGSSSQTPLDPTKTTPALLNATSEVWNLFQDFQAGIHAGIDSTTGTVWADPASGSAAAVPSGANGTAAASFGPALKALLASLPQSGSVTQQQAVTALTNAIAGSGSLGVVGQPILALIPPSASDWAQIIPALAAGFATLTPVPAAK